MMTPAADRSTFDYFLSEPYRRMLEAYALGRKQRAEEERRYKETDEPWRDLGGEG